MNPVFVAVFELDSSQGGKRRRDRGFFVEIFGFVWILLVRTLISGKLERDEISFEISL